MQQKILVIDDQPEMLDILKAALEPEGYAVTTLVYVEDIISTLAVHQPDLVILDYLLAGVNGGELCSQVKADPATAAIPVIMLSAYPRLREAFGHYGSDVLMSKPFDLQALINAVKGCLSLRAAV